MATLDPRWTVPESYEPDVDFGGRVLRQRGTPSSPTLQLLSYIALEEQLSVIGPGSLFAWQLLADEDAAVAALVGAVLEDPSADRLWCAHAMQLVGESAQRAGEVAKLAWQSPLETASDKVAAGLMLATAVAAASPEKARQFLPKIEVGLGEATPAQRATYQLLRAATDADPAGRASALDEAYKQLVALDHHFGLAQAALIALQHEQLAGTKDPTRMRGYLEHAIYRYDIGRRESWAARLIVYGLIPLLHDVIRVSDDELASYLQRAAAFATGARSMTDLASVFRLARKLGFEATVTMLDPGDPPTFTRVAPVRQSYPAMIVAVVNPEPKAEAKPDAPAKTEAKPDAPAKTSKKRKPKAR